MPKIDVSIAAIEIPDEVCRHKTPTSRATLPTGPAPSAKTIPCSIGANDIHAAEKPSSGVPCLPREGSDTLSNPRSRGRRPRARGESNCGTSPVVRTGSDGPYRQDSEGRPPLPAAEGDEKRLMESIARLDSLLRKETGTGVTSRTSRRVPAPPNPNSDPSTLVDIGVRRDPTKTGGEKQKKPRRAGGIANSRVRKGGGFEQKHIDSVEVVAATLGDCVGAPALAPPVVTASASTPVGGGAFEQSTATALFPPLYRGSPYPEDQRGGGRYRRLDVPGDGGELPVGLRERCFADARSRECINAPGSSVHCNPVSAEPLPRGLAHADRSRTKDELSGLQDDHPMYCDRPGFRPCGRVASNDRYGDHAGEPRYPVSRDEGWPDTSPRTPVRFMDVRHDHHGGGAPHEYGEEYGAARSRGGAYGYPYHDQCRDQCAADPGRVWERRGVREDFAREPWQGGFRADRDNYDDRRETGRCG